MKTVFIQLFICFSFGLMAQSSATFKTTLETNNLEHLTTLFSETVEVNLPNSSSNYSHNQAKILVLEFFNSEKIISYIRKHSGGGNGKSNFEIADLVTKKNTYRSYILFTEDNSELKIIEFRIENK